MKKKYGFISINKIPVILLTVIFIFSNLVLKAQDGIYKRFVLVEVNNFSKEKILPMLIQEAGQFPGLEIIGYCNDQSLVAIRLDDAQYPDDKVIIDFFKQLNLVVYIKENIMEYQMDAICHQTYHEISQ